MSVSGTVALPDQPTALTSGSVEYVPLGGDGFTSPKFAYNLLSGALAMDASGGTATITVTMDPRVCSLVSYATGQIMQATAADTEFLFSVSNRVPLQVLQGDTTSTVLSTSEIGVTWRPQPVVLPGGGAVRPQLFFRVPNTDGDTVRLHAMIFCYNIRVRELTPMGPLLWARGDA